MTLEATVIHISYFIPPFLKVLIIPMPTIPITVAMPAWLSPKMESPHPIKKASIKHTNTPNASNAYGHLISRTLLQVRVNCISGLVRAFTSFLDLIALMIAISFPAPMNA